MREMRSSRQNDIKDALSLERGRDFDVWEGASSIERAVAPAAGVYATL